MLTRILTSVIGIPLVILLMVLGNPVLQYAGGAIALIGVYEFYHMISKQYKPMRLLGYIATILYFICFNFFKQHYILFIAPWISILLVAMVIKYPKYSIIDMALTFIGPIYVGLLLSFIFIIRDFKYGDYLVWLVFISAWGSDTCAYFAGRMFGKHPLAPKLSPKKTIEGAVGGAIGAALIAYIYTRIFTLYAYPGLRERSIIIVGIVLLAAIISQIGDLAASAIKRQLQEKDFGHLFPGHGGVLDRFDSILLVAPFIMICILMTMGQMIL